MFRNATQNPGELLDSYCTRLRRLAQTCEFANKDEEIKSHIVVSCSSSRLRRRALREDMNLKDLLAYGRGLEMSDKQAKGIEEHEKLAKVSPVMESSIIILNSFNGNFYFSNPARNNNPVRILVMQYKTLHPPPGLIV